MTFLGLKNTNKTIEKALKSRFSIIILCLWSYTEAFIFPIPPDPFLIALILVNKNRLFLYVSLCTEGAATSASQLVSASPRGSRHPAISAPVEP